MYFDSNFTEVCSYGFNWQWSSTGLDNGLAPNRRQAIIWTNTESIHWRIYAAHKGRWVTATSVQLSRHGSTKAWTSNYIPYKHKLLIHALTITNALLHRVRPKDYVHDFHHISWGGSGLFYPYPSGWVHWREQFIDYSSTTEASNPKNIVVDVFQKSDQNYMIRV